MGIYSGHLYRLLGEDQEFLNLVQDSFLSQHVLESTRGKNVLDIVLRSQKECVDNVKIYEAVGCSDHNQIYFIIKVKGEQNRKIRYRKNIHKERYADMREYLAKFGITHWRIKQQHNAGIF